MNSVAALLLAFFPYLFSSQDPAPRVDAGIPQVFQDRRIGESSGVVASRKHPGLLWTINDSGGDPMLFLSDTAGE